MLDDLRTLVENFRGGPVRETLLTLNGIFAYASLGVLGLRTTWASLFSLTFIVTSLIVHDYGSVATSAAIVTMAVVATATRQFIKCHLLVYTAWASYASFFRQGMDGELFWSFVAAIVAPALAGAAIRYFNAQHRKNEQQVRDLEILNERLREDERQALARDLHDVVAHELTLITMQTMSRRRSEDVGELHQVVETVEGAARSALHELRVMLRLLRDENDGDHPRDVTGAGLAIGSLEHVVTSLVASLRDLRFEPEVVVTGDLEAMPTTVRGTAARILQESVTNIIKYAPRESRCRIEVTADEHELRLRVTNPLTRKKPAGGAPSELSSGMGLRGITERVSLLGGHAGSGPEDGQWVLDVNLPVNGREEAL